MFTRHRQKLITPSTANSFAVKPSGILPMSGARNAYALRANSPPPLPQHSRVHARRQQRGGDGDSHETGGVSAGDSQRDADSRGECDEEADDEVEGVPAVDHFVGGPAGPDVSAVEEAERGADETDDDAAEELALRGWRGLHRRGCRRFPSAATCAVARRRGRRRLCGREPVGVPKAMPRMGPISGETSIEATVTTELLLPSPTAAMKPAEISSSR